MSDKKIDDAREALEPEHVEATHEQVDTDTPMEDIQPSDVTDESLIQQEEEMLKKKYGGMLPKKKPLISKDHERAFFDSADWALGKQGSPVGAKPKGPLEALRPKLQPTPQQQVRSRRSAYAPTEGEDGGNTSSEEPGNAND